MSNETPMVIDVDKVIENYNRNNPELKPLTRESLSKILNCNKQVFSDWKNGRMPKLVLRLLKLKEIGKCELSDFIIEKND